MTAVSPPAFPGGATLAGWWRQLRSDTPPPGTGHPAPAFWLAHLFFHRIEALVRLSHAVRPDRLTLLALESLLLEPVAASADAAIFPMRPPVGQQLLRRLAEDGLIEVSSGHWQLTELGRGVHSQGEYHRPEHARRTFYFLHKHSPQRPHYLPLRAEGRRCPTPPQWHFDLEELHACVRQSPEWKRRHGFPLEVQEVLGTPASDCTAPAWRQVVLDSPEHLTVLLLRRAGKIELRGFRVHEDRWTLDPEPVFELGEGWTEIFPELACDLSADQWQKAWRQWAVKHGLTAPEADSCRLERLVHRVRVTVSRPIYQRLNSTAQNLLRTEAWLLAGDESWRGASALEVVAR
jgi:hypothetical protein